MNDPIIAKILTDDAERVAKRVLELIPGWYKVEDVYSAILAEAQNRPAEARLFVEALDNDPRVFHAFVESFGDPVPFPWMLAVFFAGASLGALLIAALLWGY